MNIPVEKFNDRQFKEDTCIDLDTLDYSLTAFTKDKPLLSDSKFTKMAKELNTDILNYDLTIRQLLQYYGTNCMRTYFGEDVWINSTLRHATDKTIIADCRFINEANHIKEKNGIIIYVNRPGIPFGHHQSEKEMFQMLKKNIYVLPPLASFSSWARSQASSASSLNWASISLILTAISWVTSSFTLAMM